MGVDTHKCTINEAYMYTIKMYLPQHGN